MLSICTVNPVVQVGNQIEPPFPLEIFRKKKKKKKKECLQRYSVFPVFTGIIGKSLYHLLRPTSTMLLDEIRGLCQPCLLLQIVQPRLHSK